MAKKQSLDEKLLEEWKKDNKDYNLKAKKKRESRK